MTRDATQLCQGFWWSRAAHRQPLASDHPGSAIRWLRTAWPGFRGGPEAHSAGYGDSVGAGADLAVGQTCLTNSRPCGYKSCHEGNMAKPKNKTKSRRIINRSVIIGFFGKLNPNRRSERKQQNLCTEAGDSHVVLVTHRDQNPIPCTFFPRQCKCSAEAGGVAIRRAVRWAGFQRDDYWLVACRTCSFVRAFESLKAACRFAYTANGDELPAVQS